MAKIRVIDKAGEFVHILGLTTSKEEDMNQADVSQVKQTKNPRLFQFQIQCKERE